MQVSYGLPTHLLDTDILSGAGIAQLASAAEAAGFSAVYTTEHPFPGDEWLAKGGHHALDPLVALSFAAAATTRIRLHTNLFVAAYRNPFLAAKGISTLDVLSGGRVILGIGAGYLESEFTALGTPFEDRNDRTDEAILAMRAAWSGTSITMVGSTFSATGNTMLPRPIQRPHPPIWIGGNSKRAIRRAVELGDGWSPFPNPPRSAGVTRTASLVTPADLSERLEYAAEYATSIGRTSPMDVIFIPDGLDMRDNVGFNADAVVRSCQKLAAVGVTWVAVSLPGIDLSSQMQAISAFKDQVLPRITNN